jgi:ABC-2 type transport system ATP-binding protein/lipopolysaccharide transport system ATP-binding protein
MVSIVLDEVSIEFPIYDLTGRSLRKELFNASIGGVLRKDKADRVSVQALDRVSMRVEEGDRLGIVGHNGAGKSTLLRAMAGIYEPVSGRIQVSGKVAPLFNILIGIDMDSTGYENVLARALFLDMTREEMESHMDDIMAFTDLGNYLNMPIRTYSTGMLVRLAFAIATCANADILLMDEIIGAGDAAFQKRAEARLSAFIERAGTLVIASHSAEILRAMCKTGIVLHHGKLEFSGSIDDTIQYYNDHIAQPATG